MAISNAITQSAVARAMGIETIFRDLREGRVQFLPQRIVVVGQGNAASLFALTKLQITSAIQAAQNYGFGSPIHDVAKQLFPDNGDGVGTLPVTVIPVAPGGSAVAASGSSVLTGAATKQFTGRLLIGGVLTPQFVVANGDDVTTIAAAIVEVINSVLDVPVMATSAAGVITLTAKWLGESGNDIKFEFVDTSTDSGITFSTVAMANGAVSPDVDTALAQIGNVWESIIINAAAPYTDTTVLDKFFNFGDGRWNPLLNKPCIVFNATSETSETVLAAAGNARKTDQVNCLVSMPGCKNTPWAMAARHVVKVSTSADKDPARDFGSLPLTGLIPGTDVEQFEYNQRDLLVKAGISTTEVRDGVITISDTVTFYHPTGDTLPAYRFVKTIIKLQQAIFNMHITFKTPEWDGAPLIPNDQPTNSVSARKPKAAVADANAVIGSLGLEAIISDPDKAKKATKSQISSTNPDRLDLSTTIQVSGNANIFSHDLNFGFFFGAQA